MARLTDNLNPNGFTHPPRFDLPSGVGPVRANESTIPDPFDPAAFRLSGDALGGLGVRKALLTIPVGKPEKSWFIRVHPSDEYALQTAVIEHKDEQGVHTYLVAPILWPELTSESTFKLVALFTATNRQNVLFLWSCRLPSAEGRTDEWARSALEAAELAKARWVRVQAKLSLGAYEVFEAVGALHEPEWPDVPFATLLRTAFKGRLIDTTDHPVLRQLRGEE